MEVLQIKIGNFKSFKGTDHVVDICKGPNIFVGPNGAGKTNLFLAFGFLLSGESPRFHHQKRLLVYNGDNRLAFVEVVLKSTTPGVGIFELGREVSIRRVFSPTSDYYLVNGVQMKPIVMRTVFKEITGLSNWDKIHYASHKMVKKLIVTTGAHRMKSLLSYGDPFLQRRLNTFETIETELRDVSKRFRDFMDEQVKIQMDHEEENKRIECYRFLTTEKSKLQFAIIQKSAKKLESKLRKVHLGLVKVKALANAAKTAAVSAKLEQKATEEARNQAQDDLEIQSLIVEDVIYEKEELLAKSERLRLLIEEEEKDKTEILKRLIEEEDYQDSRSEEELKTKTSQKTQLETEYLNIKKSLAEKEIKRANLMSRIECATSSNERKRKIRFEKEINSVKRKINESEMKINLYLKQSSFFETKKSALLVAKEAILEEISRLNEMKKRKNDAQRQMNSLQTTLNESRRNANVCETKIMQKNRSLFLKTNALKKILGPGIVNGIESLEKVVNKWKNSGLEMLSSRYYGLVVDNFETRDSTLALSIESAAKKLLFYHIVEDAMTGTKIVEEMKNDSLPGEVFFLPLDTLRVRQSTPPTKSLLDFLNYSDSLDRAMRFVFGNVLLCSSLEFAVSSAKTYKTICVTPEGDLIHPGGAISGGYIDPRLGAISIYKDVRKIKEDIAFLQRDLARTTSDMNSYLSLINKIDSYMEKLNLEETFSNVDEKTKSTNDELELINAELSAFERHISIIRAQNEQLKFTLEELTKEKDRPPILDPLELEALNKDIFALTKKSSDMSLDLMKYNHEIASLEKVVAVNKNRRESKLKNVSALKSCEAKVAEYEILLETCQSRLAFLQRLQDNSRLPPLTHETRSSEYPRGSEYGAKILRLENRMQHLKSELEKKEEEMAKIKPQVEHQFDPNLYRDKGLNQLLEQLKETVKKLSEMPNPQLKKNRAVHHKLLMRIREDSTTGLNVLCTLENCVPDFNKWLDFRKKHFLNAISNKFSDYFHTITRRTGRATLTYDVVGCADLKVTLCENSSIDEQVVTLSGGQQMVTLVSLVLSVLDTQNISFCIFDEISRNLSPEMTTALMEVLSGSPNSQFLISTHSQLVAKWGKAFYRLTHKNNRSHISPINALEAEEEVSSQRDHSDTPSSSAPSIRSE